MKFTKVALAALLVSCMGVAQLQAAIEVYPNNPGGDAFTNAGGTNTGQAVGASGWYYNNVRGSGSVGISSANPRSGDGSVSFSSPTPTGSGKADIEFFASAIADGNGNYNPTSALGTLAQLTSLSYEWYRNGTSDNPAAQHPSLRLQIFDPDTNQFGALVFERVYNGLPTTTDAWMFDDVFASKDTNHIWSSGTLPNNSNGTNGPIQVVTARSLAQWMSEFPQYLVTSISSGVGSGWNGNFVGAVDNITFGFSGNNETYNFEIQADGVVPEPGTIAVWSVLGLCGSAIAWRSRRRAEG